MVELKKEKKAIIFLLSTQFKTKTNIESSKSLDTVRSF